MSQPLDSRQEPELAGKAPGLSILAKLMISFIVFILLLGALLVVVYQRYVPALVRDQIELRAESITKSFAAAALQPVVERNYLNVNKIAEATAKLPDVAYATAVNDRGIAIAGMFGDLGKFDRLFGELVGQKGFPAEVIDKTRLSADQDLDQTELEIGGQRILEYAMRLGQTRSEVHVGLFTADVEDAIAATLWPLIILLSVMAVTGIAALYWVSRTVSVPIKELSIQADYISKGHLDREIDVKGSGEIWQLAESFKRMQASIKYSIMQMRRQQAKQRENELK